MFDREQRKQIEFCVSLSSSHHGTDPVHVLTMQFAACLETARWGGRGRVFARMFSPTLFSLPHIPTSKPQIPAHRSLNLQPSASGAGTHTHTNTHTTPIQTNLISSGLIHLSPFYSSTFPFTPSVQLTTSLQSPRKSHVLGWILRKWRPGGLTARGTHLGMSILIVTLHPDAKIFWRTSALSYIYIYI